VVLVVEAATAEAVAVVPMVVAAAVVVAVVAVAAALSSVLMLSAAEGGTVMLSAAEGGTVVLSAAEGGTAGPSTVGVPVVAVVVVVVAAEVAAVVGTSVQVPTAVHVVEVVVSEEIAGRRWRIALAVEEKIATIMMVAFSWKEGRGDKGEPTKKRGKVKKTRAVEGGDRKKKRRTEQGQWQRHNWRRCITAARRFCIMGLAHGKIS